jgi:hypothetical protein
LEDLHILKTLELHNFFTSQVVRLNIETLRELKCVNTIPNRSFWELHDEKKRLNYHIDQLYSIVINNSNLEAIFLTFSNSFKDLLPLRHVNEAEKMHGVQELYNFLKFALKSKPNIMKIHLGDCVGRELVESTYSHYLCPQISPENEIK